MLALTDRAADLRAELADLLRQRPALLAAARVTEDTALQALDALAAARAHYDRCTLAARDARRFADGAADRLRRHDRALADVRADLATLPQRGMCEGVAQHGA
jgi:hypothetical protein